MKGIVARSSAGVLVMAFVAAMVVASLFSGLASAQSESGFKNEMDSAWTDQQLAVIQSLSLRRLGPVPASASNAVADNPIAAKLGERLFYDKRLSSGGEMSCATCHEPARYFSDGKVQSGGPAFDRGRNTPTIVGSAHQDWFYWDGRRDSLWSQSLIPFESPDEMNSNRAKVLAAVAQDQVSATLYEQVFTLPLLIPASVQSLSAGAGPLAAEPARTNWYRLPVGVRKRLSRQYANLGKALAAYMRTLAPSASRFDQYVDALSGIIDTDPAQLITEAELAGLKLFVDDQRTQCLRCHNGARFTNEGFHNVGTGQFSGESLDFGRLLGVQSVLADEFNCRGPYSDATPAQCTALRFMSRDPHEPLSGAFKTPTLRNISATAPYFHDGRLASLREVIEHYVSPPTTGQESVHELSPLELLPGDVDALVAFLNMLEEPERQK